MPLLILALLIGLPLIEIGIFIEVGDAIGVWPTIALTIATALAGVSVVRLQGFTTFMKARAQVAEGEVPTRQLFDGFCLVLAGLMLLIPGFATDSVGVILLIPPVRSFLFKWVESRAEVRAAYYARSQGRPRPADVRGDIIEGEWQEVEEPPRDLPPGRPSAGDKPH